jgi:DNA-binding transcriptional ArsR family regulator
VVYRVHFTAEDLARTRVADAPMPLSELDLAARALQAFDQAARLDSWRRHVRARLSPQARLALALIPPVGWSPSFLAPSRSGAAEELLDQVRATPRQEIEAWLAESATRVGQSIPSWAHGLADEPSVYERLCDGLADLHAVLLSPFQRQLSDLFAADRTVRMRQVLDGGVERLLLQANPQWMRWNPPTLEIRTPRGMDQDLYLVGQGVMLVPSLFSARSVVDNEARPQPTISYPAGHDEPLRRLTTFATRDSEVKPTVSALLGRTRSIVLHIVAEHPGCSTKELAAFAGIAPASASEHATVLREAGLIHTARYRNIAIHSPTGLGIALLNTPASR